MKKGFFYTRLAWTGIRTNKRLYVPYLLTSAGMAAMFYIVAYLADSPMLREMPGGGTMEVILGFGRVVIGAFSLILLFYTNSFLIRRRNREFGLYNILGMNKGDISRILLRETIITAGISLAAGLCVGILFSKLAELFLLKIMDLDASYSLSIAGSGIVQTMVAFAAIFLLILLAALTRVRLSNPLSLLRSEAVGEKPPRANWLFAALGVVILAAAYYIAVSIREPISAMLIFFIAVLMVIVATYLLFVAGSVALCRLLQKNKRYYYRADHFVSVSSMVYRMKRNGAGLASICILSTMVLVMLSSTTCLYMGGQDALRAQCPYDFTLETGVRSPEDCTPEVVNTIEAIGQRAMGNGGSELTTYRLMEAVGQDVGGGRINVDPELGDVTSNPLAFEAIRAVEFLPLEDYNRITGETRILAPGEALIWSSKGTYPYDAMILGDSLSFTVAGTLEELPIRLSANDLIATNYYVIVPDWAETAEAVQRLLGGTRRAGVTNPLVECSFDVAEGTDTDAVWVVLREGSEALEQTEWSSGWGVRAFDSEWGDFLSLYGSLFFLGIILSVVFVFAAVLIIYYKQVSEGYEDAGRFSILRKVGMTGREIRRSINSQVLTVFFGPLLLAGIHLCFAFPLIWKIIQFFGVTNLRLLIGTNAVCFLAFGLLYVLIYRVTARVYFRIVSGSERTL